jgi:methylenetetrahydrofolate dehydrogenase (NADP+) / methenyltetrahydrofolate cyclohydrolase
MEGAMGAQIINGKEIAQEIRSELQLSVKQFRQEFNTVPGLAVILWNNNPASRLYVNNKVKACEDTGMYSEVHDFSDGADIAEILECIHALNQNDRIHGILMQLPIADNQYEQRVLEAISFTKDVDGLHPINAGNLLLGNKTFVPCTPQGIMALLDRSEVTLEGKHAVVVGRSNIVGKPVSLLLLQRHATVTVCHSRTQNLSDITKQADILVAAVGKPHFIQQDMIKPGATIIDVGINRVGKKVIGDVDFDNALKVAGKITPVPGGVGPMTIAMLLKNTFNSALAKHEPQQDS